MQIKNHIAHMKGYILAAVMLCICFFAVSLYFILHMLVQQEQESLQYLDNAALLKASTINKQLQGDIQALEAVAVYIGALESVSGEQTLEIVQRINANNHFIQMGIAGQNGLVDLLGIHGEQYPTVDLSREAFFKRALAGGTSISEPVPDPLGQGEVYYYAVPIISGTGEVAAVLCAVNGAQTLQEIIDTPLLNGTGFSNLAHADGRVLFTGLDSVLDHIQSLQALEAVQTPDVLLHALSAGQQFHFSFRAAGAEYSAGLYPLDYNGWSLVSAIPISAIRQQYGMTALGTAVILLMACAIFLFLFRLQRRNVAKNQSVLLHLAYDDALTGGRNYEKFLLDAPSLLRNQNGNSYAVWYCDLKRFQYYNDVFGYQMGDELLQRMWRLFDAAAIEGEIFCRVSADNFAGLRPYGAYTELVQWFEELIEQLRKEKEHSANRLFIELSVGFYRIQGDQISVNDMVNRANMAQKTVKGKPGSQYAFYSPEIRAQNLLEAELETQSSRAFERDEFQLYFQPKVNIQDGNRIIGAEVLSRWANPDKGLVQPNLFIPMFEANGMVVQLDRYMLERTCRWLRSYLDKGGVPVSMAVNVSRLGLLREDFVEYYVMVKSYYNIPDGLLELEFTESVTMDGDELFFKTIDELHHHGFVCSMDDFGSGYSSLNLLKDLPIDVLKLDILFFRGGVDRNRERLVVENILHMARQLQIKTIAEGVELAEDVDFLCRAGCDIVQGYVFFRPMPMQEFESLLDQQGQRPIALQRS